MTGSSAYQGVSTAVARMLGGVEFQFLEPGKPHYALAVQYLEAMLARNRQLGTTLVEQAIQEGVSIAEIYLHVFQPVQYEIGWLWQKNHISVGHEHYCTNATQMNMAMLYPRLFSGDTGPRRMVAACVQGELHELGLRMLADFYAMEGWDSDYLGANTPLDAVVSVLEEAPPQILAIGVTMHTHAEKAYDLIQAVRASSRLRDLKVLVGGRAFQVSPGLWTAVGADGTAENAQVAIELSNRIYAKEVGT